MGIECEKDSMPDRKRKRSDFQLDDIPEDGTLCSIVSHLPMREAARTSLLSRRWRHLWTDATHLNFDSVNMFGIDRLGKSVRKLDNADRYRRWRKERREFIPAVNRFLDHHRGTGVDTFRVDFLLHNQHACHLNRWVEFAIASGAKQLVLNLDDEYIHCSKQPYEFPLHLFAGREGSSIQQLRLQFCALNPPRNFDGLKCLKELHLDSVGVTEGDMLIILSSCSLLELLSIKECQSLFNLYIPQSSSRLTYLNVEVCRELKRIESHAMNLNTFEYTESNRSSLLFKESAQLTSASIFVHVSHAVVKDVLDRLTRNLPYLETLCLEMYSYNAVVTSPKVTNVFAHLKHLTIFSGYFLSGDICWVAAFLRAAPVMEKLNLHIDSLPKQNRSSKCNIIEPCLHVHLKEVMITGFSARKDQLELAKYVLHSATTLEQMTINLSRAKYFKLSCVWKLKNGKGPQLIRVLSRRFQTIAPPSVNMVIYDIPVALH